MNKAMQNISSILGFIWDIVGREMIIILIIALTLYAGLLSIDSRLIRILSEPSSNEEISERRLLVDFYLKDRLRYDVLFWIFLTFSFLLNLFYGYTIRNITGLIIMCLLYVPLIIILLSKNRYRLSGRIEKFRDLEKSKEKNEIM